MAFMLIPETVVRENFSWRTDILTSLNGSEQRLSLIDEPRISMSATFFLDEAQFRTIRREVDSRIKTITVVPQWQYTARLTTETGSGGTRIYFDKSVMSLNDGQYICLIDLRTKEVYEHTIFNVETDGVTLNETLTINVDKNFIAVPGILAVIDSNTYNWEMVSGDVQLSFNSTKEPLFIGEGNAASLTLLGGIPVVTETFINGTKDEIDFNYELLDNEIGKREYRTRETLARVKGERTFIFERYTNPEKMQWWRKFLDTVKGSWKPIYISTQLEDFVTPNNSLNGDDYILVDDLDYVYSEAYGAIEIEYSDGSVSHHRISTEDPLVVDGVTYKALSLVPILPNDDKVQNITRVSYLLKTRIDDTVKMVHDHRNTSVTIGITSTNQG